MWYYLIKLAISAALIVLISETSKRFSWLGGLLASLPLVSILSLVWLYVDTEDSEKVAALSTSIFWLVLPSLTFFLAMPLLLKKWSFVPSLLIATVIMIAAYGLMMLVLRRLGVTD
jgi:uncharacterized membrane protein (GlpM family)